MRTHLFLLLMIFSFTLSKAQWVEIDPGVDNALYDIYAITPDIVVAVGTNGTIIKTIDGGETWQQKESETTKDLLRVEFPTPEVGYAFGYSVFLKSTNGGETWFSLNESSDCSFIDFSWVSEELLFSKCNGYLIKSIDGGHTWTEVSPSIVENLQFMNNDVGYGINGLNLYRTVNGGETWEFIKFLPDIHFIVDNSQFMNHVVGYGTYDYLNLFRSENGGESLEQNNFFSGISLRFIDENTGFYYESGLWKTIDSGSNFEFIGGEFGEGFSFFYVENENRTWGILHPLLDGDGSSRGVVKSEILDDGTYAEEVYLEYDPNTHMFSIHFAEENTGYIVGYSHGNPTIWKNSTGINTMSTAEQVETAKIKVYPNPASDILNIDLGKTFTEIKVSLSDVSGKQFISETHKQKDKLSIHTQTLPKGVYVLSIQTNQHNFNKKIIIN